MAKPEETLIHLTEGAVETSAIERAVIRVKQMSQRCHFVKEVEAFQRSLLDPASDLKQTLQEVRTAIEGSACEYEDSQLIVPNSETFSSGSTVLNEISVFLDRFVILSKPELLVIS